MAHSQSIQTKFFFFYFCINVFILGIFSVFFHIYFSDILIKREMKAFEDKLAFFEESTDNAIRMIDDVSVSVSTNRMVKERAEKYFNNPGDEGRTEFLDLAEIFRTLNEPNNRVLQVYLYDFNGGAAGMGQVNRYYSYNPEYFSWMKPVNELSGVKYLSAPYESQLYSGSASVSHYYLSLYRLRYNLSGEPCGYSESVQNCRIIFKNIITRLKNRNDSLQVCVYNERGDLLYPYDSSSIQNPDIVRYADIAKKGKSVFSYYNADAKTEELVSSQKSLYSNWTYVCFQPKNEVLAPVNNFTRLIILITLSWIPVTFFIAWITSRTLATPIQKLVQKCRNMDLEKLGTPEGDVFDTSVRELDELNAAFVQMGQKLKASMNNLILTRQQEVRSRSLALQSQINPHFYYNTLSSIIILAENERPKDVVKLCTNLSSIMRYITDGSSLTVPIAEELEYITEYLYCMKVRYQSSLNYEITVDPEVYSLVIPKLIIQPLVENALKYGTNCDPPWSVSISSEITDTEFRIFVKDTGPGFTPESLEKINSGIAAVCSQEKMVELSINGLGILNVYSRWKIYCGSSPCFFECHNREDMQGAVVMIGGVIAAVEQKGV
jgi:two-component system, sensor histidine kinase YesM